MENSELKDLKSFWTWGGCYIGYRLTDSLFSREGKQLGYFAEGDEVYGCNGKYMGEIRTSDRLITNVKKKLWSRGTVVPSVQRSVPGHPNVGPKAMLANFEDFPCSQEMTAA